MAPGMIVGIDVETANTDGAICEFGAVAIDALMGAEVFRVANLVNPGQVRWDRHCMMAHRLSESMVSGSPPLIDIWQQFLNAVQPHRARCRFFAHSATSDQRQLASGLGTRFDLQLECTRVLAKEHLPGLSGYSLSVVCESLPIPLLQAHRAAADAEASARVAQRLLMQASTKSSTNQPSPTVVSSRCDLKDANDRRGRLSDWASEPTTGIALHGKTVVITGEFANGWKRVDAKRHVKRHGGAPADSVSRFTSLVVVAGVGEPLLEHHLTTAKAKDARKFGIPVISEPEFLRLIGIDIRSNA